MRRAVIFAAAAACALVLLACESAPDLRVSGIVRDAATGEPVAGARIHEGRYAPGLAAGATSDAAGRFAYFTYPEEHSVYAEKEGYEAASALVGLDPRSRAETLEISLAKR